MSTSSQHTLGIDVPCRSCNTNLLGQSAGAACAACGTPITESLASPLAISRPCIACSYSLLGLPMNGSCPECGTPVLHSLAASALELADARFLKRVRRGTTLALAGVLCLLVGGLAVVGGFVYMQFQQGFLAGIGVLAICVYIFFVLAGLHTVLSSLGWWWITSPQPLVGGHEPLERSRQWARTMLTLSIATLAILIALAFVPSSAWSMTFLPLLFLGGFAMLAASALLILRHIARLSVWAPSKTLAWRVMWCQYFTIAATGGMLVYGGLDVSNAVVRVNMSGPTWLNGMQTATGVLVMVFFLAMMVAYTRMLSRLRSLMGRALQAKRSIDGQARNSPEPISTGPRMEMRPTVESAGVTSPTSHSH